MKKGKIAKPIIKWPGGKKQLLPYLNRFIPIKFQTYIEPFVGGGAFFFNLYNKMQLSKAILSDANNELIELYSIVRDRVEEVIEELDSGKFIYDKEVFYHIRSWEPEDPVIRSARFIYLNRTCFNGLYRVNSKGKFNVPFGRYKNPIILDAKGLQAASIAFQSCILQVDDFEQTVKDASKGDFINFDPPYAPLSRTADFTSYTKIGFGFDEQKRLAKVFRELDKKGCFVLESNSATDAIRELYNEFSITEVYASRAISSDSSTRGKIPEFLISNYEPTDGQTTLNEF